jgi:hypothetical protein
MKVKASAQWLFASLFIGISAPCMSATNQIAPDFTATDINGSTRSLSEFAGSVVLLEFWYTW